LIRPRPEEKQKSKQNKRKRRTPVNKTYSLEAWTDVVMKGQAKGQQAELWHTLHKQAVQKTAHLSAYERKMAEQVEMARMLDQDALPGGVLVRYLEKGDRKSNKAHAKIQKKEADASKYSWVGGDRTVADKLAAAKALDIRSASLPNCAGRPDRRGHVLADYYYAHHHPEAQESAAKRPQSKRSASCG
jgi:hypothetical protein